MPFRRMTDPCLVPVSATASNYSLPAGIVTALDNSEYSSFFVVNSNACWVRFRGSRDSFVAATEGEGWLVAPGFSAVFGTQKPKYMSAIAVAREGFPITGITFYPLEVSYGVGE